MARTLLRPLSALVWLLLAAALPAARSAAAPPSERAGGSVASEGGGAARTRPLNVLFIAVDDLRPALGCYGDGAAITPQIDRLAARGVLFQHAYCQEAVCNPSRASLLTGRRPDTIRVWDLKTHFRDFASDVITLPQYFKNHGYVTQSIGKVLHGNGRPAKDPPSWTEPPLFDVALDAPLRYATPHNLAGTGLKRDASESADVPDNQYVDGMVCDAAVKALAALKRRGDPFFLAVGFRKPHLPFCAPEKYWELYDPARIPPPRPAGHPRGAPELAVRSWRELEGYRDIPDDGLLTKAQIARLRHGYYACVSYADAQIGRLLDQLDRLGLADRTVICLWGDHGYHLGEQGLWTKSNNYELATRAPLIFSFPGCRWPGRACEAMVEFVDIYPTLVDLCGFARPDGLEGVSLKPLLEDPGRSGKEAVRSQFPRAATGARYRGRGDFMGYALRTRRYRYVEWRRNENGAVIARELYDHQCDPQEAVNVAELAEHASTAARLSRLLRAGPKAILSP